MKPSLVIIGAGRHGRIVAEAARESGKFPTIAFADDNTPPGTLIDGIPVLGGWRDIAGETFVIAIGDNPVREKIHGMLVASAKNLATVISPRAHVSPGAEIGAGTVILAGACIQAGATIGDNVVVNIGVLADHDAVVGAHANVAPGCVLACFARVERGERLAPGTVRGGTPPA